MFQKKKIQENVCSVQDFSSYFMYTSICCNAYTGQLTVKARITNEKGLDKELT